MSKHAKFDGTCPAPTQREMYEFALTQNADMCSSSMCQSGAETYQMMVRAMMLREVHECVNPPCGLTSYIKGSIVMVALSMLALAELEGFDLSDEMGSSFLAMRAMP